MEEVVLARLTHVGVDEKRALAELREDDREIGRQVGTPFAALRADDGEHLALLGAIEPAQHELAADRAQLLDARAERLIGGHQLVAQRVSIAWRLAQVGVGELARQRELDVGFADQPEAHRRLAEAQVVLLLVLEHALGVFGLELPPIDEDGAERSRRPRRIAEHGDRCLHARTPGKARGCRVGGGAPTIKSRRKTGRFDPAGRSTPITGTPAMTIRSSGMRTRRSTISRPMAARMPAASPPRIEPTMPSSTFGREGSSGSTAGLSKRVFA